MAFECLDFAEQPPRKQAPLNQGQGKPDSHAGVK